jgi:uncharacterized protein (TIGR02302 family)
VRRGLAWLSLLWERSWPHLWPVVAIIGLFITFALFNLLPLLPGWLHAIVLIGFALALALITWRSIGSIRLPDATSATRKLETDSNLAHRPLTTIADRPATGVVDAQTAQLWQAHLDRAAAAARNIHLRWPHPNLAARDPYALRIALVLTLFVAALVAGPDATSRIARSISPDLSTFTQRTSASVELWITPPEYTNLPPLLLASADTDSASTPTDSADGKISVPVGSTLLAQVNAGRGKPELGVGDTTQALNEVSDKAWHIETTLDDPGSKTLTLEQSGTMLGHWDVVIMTDGTPDIRFAESPDANESNSLRLSYESRDDYGVVGVQARITWPGNPQATGIPPIDLEMPLPRPDRRSGTAASIHDLTAHPWAGLEVDVQLTARDGNDQTGTTDRLSVFLPERSFNHPVAREIIEQRRVLALSPENRRDVARSLHNLGRFPDRFDNDYAVFLALITAQSRLIHEPQSAGVVSVLSLLWDTALRLADGSLSLAQRDVAELQERLREAIENGASEEELREIMDELRAALDRYLEALAQNLSQALEGMDLSTLPEAGEEMNLIDREAIENILNQLEQMAQLGDTESVQELLERMQQMLQALQNAPNNPQQQPSSLAQQFMRELQQVLRNQEGLHNETFQRDQQVAQMTPSESQAAREAQNDIRRQLGELMRRLGELSNQIPENLGDAESAMGEAERALGEGDLQSALGAQARALEELRQGGQQMALQIMRQRGQGQGPGQAEGLFQPGEDGFDPLGRPTQPDDNSAEGFLSNGQQAIGDGDQAARALEILEELRGRLRDQGRPESEIDYLLRLLRRF